MIYSAIIFKESIIFSGAGTENALKSSSETPSKLVTRNGSTVDTPQHEPIDTDKQSTKSGKPQSSSSVEANELSADNKVIAGTTPSVDKPSTHVPSASSSSPATSVRRNNPVSHQELLRPDCFDNGSVRSPKVRKLNVQTTPVRNYQNISTPETPYEEVFDEVGKTARKRIKRWIDRMEAEKLRNPLPPPPPARRPSTVSRTFFN